MAQPRIAIPESSDRYSTLGLLLQRTAKIRREWEPFSMARRPRESTYRKIVIGRSGLALANKPAAVVKEKKQAAVEALKRTPATLDQNRDQNCDQDRDWDWGGRRSDGSRISPYRSAIA